jgi:hypothetical protein
MKSPGFEDDDADICSDESENEKLQISIEKVQITQTMVSSARYWDSSESQAGGGDVSNWFNDNTNEDKQQKLFSDIDMECE